MITPLPTLKKTTRLLYLKIANCLPEFRENKILILGDGRSGTTWIQQVLNHDGRFIEFFEPFHKNKIHSENFYPVSDSLYSKESYILDIVNGLGVQKRVSEKPKIPLYRGILIKDVSCFFWLEKLNNLCPSLKFIGVVRNPISVALSKMKYGHWCKAEEFKGFPVNDEQRSQIDNDLWDIITKSAKSEFLWHILNWSHLNSILIGHAKQFGFPIVFYENLKADPEKHFETIFNYLNLNDFQSDCTSNLMAALSRSSKTTNHRAQTHSNNEADLNLSQTELDAVRKILSIYELGNIYDSNWLPRTIDLDQCVPLSH
ncbi:MAG: sulfotransferase domain-containing protein [Cyanobacteria bacterium P01_A01_bin.116]